ncbi:hypothetical protein [Rugamonas apoptosis]|uniref:Uncharacterized protein n=1 Tax=Rugamonas apoptosis TaxID=2758570 RepID=A0A7W2FFF0_9BURK|nr:hypothetical protein [Rugamonas apoptosis]MBA5690642.1 hypothetical protein [Rugamonas apoptosis]
MKIISIRPETADLDADEAEHAFATSGAFQVASERAFQIQIVDEQFFQSARVPAVVCAALSVELGIKARIIADGNRKKYRALKGAAAHHLATIFAMLSSDDQSWFIKGSNLPVDEFNEKLQSVSAAFVDWRYVYEKSERVIDFSFLSKLAILASSLPSDA